MTHPPSSPTAMKFPANGQRPTDEVIFRNLSTTETGESFSRYGDAVWDLKPMVPKQTVESLRINFSTLPITFRQSGKRIVWTWINELTPVDQLVRFTNMRDRLQGSSIVSNFVFLRKFLVWLDERAVPTLSAVSSDHFRAYALAVSGQVTVRRAKTAGLFAITRAWLMAPYLPEADRLRVPNWEDPMADEGDQLVALVGPRDSRGTGNKTFPIHPQTMSPLILAALRCVEAFAPDISAAISDRVRMEASIPQDHDAQHHAKVDSYIRDLQASGRLVPSNDYSRRGVAMEYLSATLEVARHTLRPLREMPLGNGAPMPTPIMGTVDGRPWCDHIDYYDVPRLRRMLILACYIVVAYLSGMRVEEVRALRRGCCVAAQNDSTAPAHYAIRGLTFKGVEDDNGNLIPEGVERERPWLVVEPVARAIAVAESLHSGQFVFDDVCLKGCAGVNLDRPVTNSGIRRGIVDFVAWWNSHSARSERSHESIPPDPDGEITPSRFRRTLAWFIYRVPGGRIALGLQYGHLRGITTDGYANRVASGLQDVFPVEEALSVADNLRAAASMLDGGEQVSGPAADRYVRGVRLFQRSFEGSFLTSRQISALRRDPSLRIYDNPERALACVYDQAKALCHPDRITSQDITRTPDMTRCRDNCGNSARTDRHAAALEHELDLLREEVASPLTPEPIRDRLMARIHRRESEVQTHRRESKPR